MINYIIRRLGYGVLILIGVNLFTFVLFFTVNTPDDMARMNIGGKRVTQDAIEKWKVERGYNKPLLWNAQKPGIEKVTDTIFYERSVQLFAFRFGASDSGRDIGMASAWARRSRWPFRRSCWASSSSSCSRC
jgi:peptide/nickel transport system permease protein